MIITVKTEEKKKEIFQNLQKLSRSVEKHLQYPNREAKERITRVQKKLHLQSICVIFSKSNSQTITCCISAHFLKEELANGSFSTFCAIYSEVTSCLISRFNFFLFFSH